MQATDPQWVVYLNAISTAAVAAFALVEAIRISRDRNQRARVAHARLALGAEALARLVQEWNLAFPVDTIYRTDRPFGDADFAALVIWSSRVLPDLPKAERHMLDLVDTAASARPRLARAVHDAASALLRARDELRELEQGFPLPGSVAEDGRSYDGWRPVVAACRDQLRDAQNQLHEIAWRSRRPLYLLPRWRRR